MECVYVFVIIYFNDGQLMVESAYEQDYHKKHDHQNQHLIHVK